MGTPGVQVSPWVWQAGDNLGRTITATVVFNNATKALTSASVVRQAGCLYAKLYFGTGPDGTPNTAPGTFPCTVGTTNESAANLLAGGFSTINDVLALQVTAGP